MNEEEIINGIKEIIEQFYVFPNPISIEFEDNKVKTLEGILDLYNKEKEKNKETEEQRDSLLWQRNTIDIPTIEELERKNKELLEERKHYAEEYIHNNLWLYKQLNELYIFKTDVNKNYISKDKIKQRIKELEEMRDDHADEIKRNVRFYSIYDSYNLQIAELQELLEEG